MSKMHAQSASYFRAFNYVIKYKTSSNSNPVVNAFSRKAILLIIVSQEVVGFEFEKDFYKEDEDFVDVWGKV